jgi:hypothetical protein
MNERARQLHATADAQLGELIDLTTGLDANTARRPCPGREKLGDGTIATLVTHTADNYQRIARFLDTTAQTPADAPIPQGKHRIRRLAQSIAHRIPDHAQHQPREPNSTATNLDRDAMVSQLSNTRASLQQIAALPDSRLDTTPAADSFRFADGQRTLEQVLAGLLKHQGRQLDAIRAAVPES